MNLIPGILITWLVLKYEQRIWLIVVFSVLWNPERHPFSTWKQRIRYDTILYIMSLMCPIYSKSACRCRLQLASISFLVWICADFFREKIRWIYTFHWHPIDPILWMSTFFKFQTEYRYADFRKMFLEWVSKTRVTCKYPGIWKIWKLKIFLAPTLVLLKLDLPLTSSSP